MSIIKLRVQCAKLSVISCKRLYAGLSRIPFFRVHPTAANFFLIKLAGLEPARLKKHLAQHRIKVRTRPDMTDYIRVTSMLPRENQYLLDAVAEFNPELSL